MVQLQRKRTRHDSVDAAGNGSVLIGEQISLRLGFGGFGAGVSYERPIAVERAGAVTAITDFVMVAKLAGVLAVTLAMIVGVVRR